MTYKWKYVRRKLIRQHGWKFFWLFFWETNSVSISSKKLTDSQTVYFIVEKTVAASADNVNFWFVGMLKNWSTNVGCAKILTRRTHSKTSSFSEEKLSQSLSPKKSSDIHIALNYCGKNSRNIWRYVRYSAYGKVQKLDNFWSISMLEAQLFWQEEFIQRLPIFWSKIWINILP